VLTGASNGEAALMSAFAIEIRGTDVAVTGTAEKGEQAHDNAMLRGKIGSS
jgi:hypothetical protein